MSPRPRSIIALSVVICLGAAAAWLEYSQYSSLMLSTASADVSQLCEILQDESSCPATLSFPARAAEDPWQRPYRCRSDDRGLVVYTLGADDSVGGTRRDTDIACSTFAADSAPSAEAACFCGAGDSVSALLR